MARKYWPMGKASEIWYQLGESASRIEIGQESRHCVRSTDWTFETWARCQEAGIKLLRTNKHNSLPFALFVDNCIWYAK